MAKLKGDNVFKAIVAVTAASALLILLLNAFILFSGAEPALAKYGFNFITGINWSANLDLYGVLPYILGTLITSGIALLIGVPLSLGIAIFLGRDGSKSC